MNWSWVWLAVAGLCEVCWAAGLKYSEGFTRWVPVVFAMVTMALSVGLLTLAMRQLPLGTAYAVWTGIGAVGTAILGMILFGEPAAWPRLLCLTLIVAGIVGLKLLSR